jgi:hypothetical protein
MEIRLFRIKKGGPHHSWKTGEKATGGPEDPRNATRQGVRMAIKKAPCEWGGAVAPFPFRLPNRAMVFCHGIFFFAFYPLFVKSSTIISEIIPRQSKVFPGKNPLAQCLEGLFHKRTPGSQDRNPRKHDSRDKIHIFCKMDFAWFFLWSEARGTLKSPRRFSWWPGCGDIPATSSSYPPPVTGSSCSSFSWRCQRRDSNMKFSELPGLKPIVETCEEVTAFGANRQNRPPST